MGVGLNQRKAIGMINIIPFWSIPQPSAHFHLPWLYPHTDLKVNTATVTKHFTKYFYFEVVWRNVVLDLDPVFKTHFTVYELIVMLDYFFGPRGF